MPRVLLEDLAAKTLASENVGQIGKVMDQYLNFSSLEVPPRSCYAPLSCHIPSTARGGPFATRPKPQARPHP